FLPKLYNVSLSNWISLDIDDHGLLKLCDPPHVTSIVLENHSQNHNFLSPLDNHPEPDDHRSTPNHHSEYNNPYHRDVFSVQSVHQLIHDYHYKLRFSYA